MIFSAIAPGTVPKSVTLNMKDEPLYWRFMSGTLIPAELSDILSSPWGTLFLSKQNSDVQLRNAWRKVIDSLVDHLIARREEITQTLAINLYRYSTSAAQTNTNPETEEVRALLLSAADDVSRCISLSEKVVFLLGKARPEPRDSAVKQSYERSAEKSITALKMLRFSCVKLADDYRRQISNRGQQRDEWRIVMLCLAMRAATGRYHFREIELIVNAALETSGLRVGNVEIVDGERIRAIFNRFRKTAKDEYRSLLEELGLPLPANPKQLPEMAEIVRIFRGERAPYADDLTGAIEQEDGMISTRK